MFWIGTGKSSPISGPKRSLLSHLKGAARRSRNGNAPLWNSRADATQPWPWLCTNGGVLDVLVIGGGPAGLSAALMLGRCRRRVLVCDSGTPRNASARALHGYLTRDGIPPPKLLEIGREELRVYGVELRQVTVVDVACTPEGFAVQLETGERFASRKLLVATGVRDHVPDIDGLADCYGISVHHCPYCDGWEARDRALAVVGSGSGAAGLALSLKTWSRNVVICSNGRARIPRVHRDRLATHEVEVIERRIARVEHHEGHVHRLVMHDGSDVACEAVFFSTGQSPQCDLARRLGCEFTRKGTVRTDHLGQTRVPGLYVVGDASRDVQFVIVAAAEGAKAAVAINKALQETDGLTVAPAQAS
jgi:thioredoxin reductase